MIDWVIRYLIRNAHGAPRVIMGRNGKTPYLTRYFLFRHSTATEGMDRHDNPPPWGLYLHHFHRSDDDSALHNHPWKWAVSLILKGGYSEERRVGDRVIRRKLEPGDLNILTDKDFHRADLLDTKGGAWSLFLVGPITQSWGFWDRHTKRFTKWKIFLGIEPN